MSPADLVLDLLFQAVTWVATWLPRLPAPWLATVDTHIASAGELVAGVPYSSLIPWTVVGAVATGLPVVFLAAMVARTFWRLFAWVRSRGISDS